MSDAIDTGQLLLDNFKVKQTLSGRQDAHEQEPDSIRAKFIQSTWRLKHGIFQDVSIQTRKESMKDGAWWAWEDLEGGGSIHLRNSESMTKLD